MCIGNARHELANWQRNALDEWLLNQASGLIVEAPGREYIGPVRLDLRSVVADRRYLFSSTKSWKCFKRSERLAGDWPSLSVGR